MPSFPTFPSSLVCGNYNYTLYFDEGLFNVTEALAQFDMEGRAYLNGQMTQANVPVQVVNYTSTPSAECDAPINGLPPNLDKCITAETLVCVASLNILDTELVGRLILSDVRKFFPPFNANYTNEMLAQYDYPVPVKSAIVMTLEGVPEPLSANGETILRDTFETNFGVAMQQQGFVLINAIVFLQTALLEKSQKQKQQQEQRGNQLQLLFTANCRMGCTRESFQKAVTSDASESFLENNMLPVLQATSEADYFNQVEKISLSGDTSSILNVNVTKVLQDATSGIPPFQLKPIEIEDEEITWWIWVLLAATVVIIGMGGMVAYCAVQRRNEKLYIQHEYDRHVAEAARGGGGRGGASVASRSSALESTPPPVRHVLATHYSRNTPPPRMVGDASDQGSAVGFEHPYNESDAYDNHEEQPSTPHAVVVH
ncbi:hypothetical protein ACA910_000305 [Epithemia clementina (nom. ined.)]